MKCLQFGSWFCVIWTLQMRIKRFFPSWFLFFPSFASALSLSLICCIHFFFLRDDPVALHFSFLFFFSLNISCFKIRLDFASFARAISACRGFVVRFCSILTCTLSVMLLILIHFATMQTLFLFFMCNIPGALWLCRCCCCCYYFCCCWWPVFNRSISCRQHVPYAISMPTKYYRCRFSVAILYWFVSLLWFPFVIYTTSPHRRTPFHLMRFNIGVYVALNQFN